MVAKKLLRSKSKIKIAVFLQFQLANFLQFYTHRIKCEKNFIEWLGLKKATSKKLNLQENDRTIAEPSIFLEFMKKVNKRLY